MFMIENVVCDDSKVGDVLKALAGKVLLTPTARPLINAEVRSGQLVEITQGRMIDLFASYIKRLELSEVKPIHVREFLRLNGRPDDSYSYLLNQAVKTGLVRKVGKGMASRYMLPHKLLEAPKKKGNGS